MEPALGVGVEGLALGFSKPGGSSDSGESWAIAQTEVRVLANDDENSLHERIKQQERKLLVSVVSDFVSGKIRTKSRS